MNAGMDENLVKNLRKFTSAHAPLMNWAGFQALQVKRVPSNIRQQALLVNLDYRPSASDAARRYVSLSPISLPLSTMLIVRFLYRFSVKSTHFVPRTYVTDNDPLVTDDIRR